MNAGRIKPSGGLLALCLALLLLAAGLRFHHLGRQSFWNDEGSSYVQATRSFSEIAANAARDIHPPGYYWALAVWRGVVGESEFALRALSAFASLLTVAFSFGIGKHLFNPAAGLVAGLFVALNTFSLYYAQEARMYAPLALWAAASIWTLIQAISGYSNTSPSQSLFRSSTTRYLLALALINTAGLYTQYAYPFVMLAQGGIFLAWWLLALTRRSIPGTQSSILLTYIAANIVTIILYLPWLPTALQQITQWPSTGQPIPPAEAISTILGYFTYGITYGDIQSAGNYIPLELMLLVSGLIAWFVLNGRRILWRIWVPLIWAGLPVVLFLALGLFRPANLKFLLPSQIGFALLMGAGIGGWWALGQNTFRGGRLTRVFALIQTLWLGVYLVNGLAPFYDDPRYQRPDYRAMVATISASPRPGDAIILDAPNQEEVFRYYYRGDAPIYPLPPGLGGNDAETLAAVEGIIDRHDRIFVLFWGEAERDPNHIVETTLDAQAFEAGQDIWYGDVRFARYAAPVQLLAPITLGARFGESIRLDRYALSDRAAQPGDVLQIRFDWRAEAPISGRYKVFVQLLNEGGVLVAQRDTEPVGNTRPTTTWTPDETVVDNHGLPLPDDLPPGEYQLIAGLYNIDDPSQRLPTVGRRTYVLLAVISVS